RRPAARGDPGPPKAGLRRAPRAVVARPAPPAARGGTPPRGAAVGRALLARGRGAARERARGRRPEPRARAVDAPELRGVAARVPARVGVALGPERAMDLTIIVPVRNEAESLPILWQELAAVLGGLARSAEVIFVDDGSTDASAAVIDGLAER